MSSRAYGRYILEERIAMGGMAEIFRARTATEGFSKLVCIKRILPHFVEDEDFVEMFRDEARMAAKLQHANVVQVFDFGEEEGTLYLAMELVDGRDLRRILQFFRKKGEHVPVGQAVQIAVGMCRGLHHAHTVVDGGVPLHMVHRDVSPHNVLISRAGDVKITDFGIAKAASRSTRTSTGVIKGKLAYMAPEQASDGALDHRTDQFATGIVLWEMLTGERLFKGESESETLRAVLSMPIPAPSTLRKDVPAALDAVVLRALARSPNERFADMRAFEQALTQFLYSGAVDPASADLHALGARLDEVAEPSRKTQILDVRAPPSQPATPVTPSPQTIASSQASTETDAAPASAQLSSTAPSTPPGLSSGSAPSMTADSVPAHSGEGRSSGSAGASVFTSALSAPSLSALPTQTLAPAVSPDASTASGSIVRNVVDTNATRTVSPVAIALAAQAALKPQLKAPTRIGVLGAAVVAALGLWGVTAWLNAQAQEDDFGVALPAVRGARHLPPPPGAAPAPPATAAAIVAPDAAPAPTTDAAQADAAQVHVAPTQPEPAPPEPMAKVADTPQGGMWVSIVDSWARITVGRRELADQCKECQISLPAGRHVLRFENTHTHASATRSIMVKPGVNPPLKVTLIPGETANR